MSTIERDAGKGTILVLASDSCLASFLLQLRNRCFIRYFADSVDRKPLKLSQQPVESQLRFNSCSEFRESSPNPENSAPSLHLGSLEIATHRESVFALYAVTSPRSFPQACNDILVSTSYGHWHWWIMLLYTGHHNWDTTCISWTGGDSPPHNQISIITSSAAVVTWFTDDTVWFLLAQAVAVLQSPDQDSLAPNRTLSADVCRGYQDPTSRCVSYVNCTCFL